jgi:hypothetical protein
MLTFFFFLHEMEIARPATSDDQVVDKWQTMVGGNFEWTWYV